jgi:selenoprotein W-related protein
MAEILADKVLESRIESFELVPSRGGLFEFSADEKLLFSKKELGRHAEPGEVLQLLRSHMDDAQEKIIEVGE